ncbi:MAG: hypothetical protein HYY24_14760 [Verrucomicrobia bacterium]|nr:hypothetical protein [Verrucomicrobiota bacterium]
MKRPLPQSKNINHRRKHLAIRVALATVLAASLGAGVLKGVAAEGKVYPTRPGGMATHPYIFETGISTQKLKLHWYGLSGPYKIERKLNLNSPAWEQIGSTERERVLTLDAVGESGFFRVTAPTPNFAGAETCLECHGEKHAAWAQTAHAGALEALKAINQDKNTACLACHTVGFGLPSGYEDATKTSHLKGVQCESCHGPAAEHASNPDNLSARPIVELSARTCGGCHTDVHHPTFDEWATSGHGSLEIPEEEFASPTSGPGRMPTCGACHSAATRLALLREVKRHPDPTQFAPVFPTTEEAASSPIACIACHDAHEKTANPGQLRFPLASKVPYSYLTSTNFAKNYNPQVQTCAQCHNMRGATWTGTSRPPHHSPQYNMLIGNGGFDAGATSIPQSAHMDIENQCAHCHTHGHAPDEITEQTPAYTGHDFRPTLKGCLPCHDEVGGGLLQEVVQAHTKKEIGKIKGLLDQWALTKAPEALRQKYGVAAWEFTNIGQLTTRPPGVTTGPASGEQATIPDNIKQARFNLYLVEHDASYGVHNGNYARFLLKVAEDKVKAELAQ